MNLTLSVGVPTYNQCGHLRETLVSLLRQELPPLEIVVSDNHSTDETRAVLDEFRQAITVTSPPNHLGMMEHWNYLAAQLQGEWFSLLSSDDEARPTFVRTLTRGIARHPTAVLVRSGWEHIGAGSRAGDQSHLQSVRRGVRPQSPSRENIAGPNTSLAALAAGNRARSSLRGFPRECGGYRKYGCWLLLSTLSDRVCEHLIVARGRISYRLGLGLVGLGERPSDEEILGAPAIPYFHSAFGERHQSAAHRAIMLRLLARPVRLCELIPPFARDSTAVATPTWAGAPACVLEPDRFRRGEEIRLRRRRLRMDSGPIANAQ